MFAAKPNGGLPTPLLRAIWRSSGWNEPTLLPWPTGREEELRGGASGVGKSGSSCESVTTPRRLGRIERGERAGLPVTPIRFSHRIALGRNRVLHCL